jgi:tetratricopeptide (TPR) repeat protein
MREDCLRAVALGLFCLTSSLALGAPDESVAAEARRHFSAGTDLYAKGRMEEALAEFEKANQLKPDPALLYDLAQTHRALGHDGTALTFYRAFLQAAPYAPNQEEVRSKIRILEEELARVEAERKRVESTIAVAVARAAEAEEAKRIAKELSSVAALQAARLEEAQKAAHEAELRAQQLLVKDKQHTPLYKKWWLWTIVGSVVVAGVVTAAVLAQPQIPSTTQGNFSAF